MELFAKGQVGIHRVIGRYPMCVFDGSKGKEGGARPIVPLCVIESADQERRRGGEC